MGRMGELHQRLEEERWLDHGLRDVAMEEQDMEYELWLAKTLPKEVKKAHAAIRRREKAALIRK